MAKKKYQNDDILNRNFKRYSDKDLINIMNKVAASQSQDSNTAKNGKTMRVKAKNLLFSNLPNIKQLRGMMAEEGATAGPGPVPRTRNFIKTLPDNYFDMFGQPEHAKLPPLAPIDKGPINTQNALPMQGQLTNPGYYPQPQMQHRKFNAGNAMLLGMEAIDLAIPGEKIHNQQVIRPQEGYNQYPLGTGSQALMEDGGGVGPGKPSINSQIMKMSGHRADYLRGILLGKIAPPEEASKRGQVFQHKEIFNPYDAEDLSRGEVKGGPMLPGPLAGGSSNFSFTGRDESGHQTTKYFSDLDTWRRASDMLGYSHREITNNDRAASATGIGNQFDDGGVMMDLDRDTPMMIPEGMFGNTPHANLGAGIPWGNMLQYENLNTNTMDTAKSGNWIQKAVNPKHKGYCTPMTKKTCTPRRKALARTFKKHHGFHEFGGIIPDNMSNFTQYDDGGTSRGGSDTFNLLEQIVMHPNQSDMAGWEAMYGRTIPLGPKSAKDLKKSKVGSSLRGGSDTMNIFEQIVMHPNVSDMQGWDKAKKGKTLSRSKAREILHDGTAQGHKLTDKQRRYFGAVASGYAAAGLGIPGEGGPGGGFTAQNLISSKTSGYDDAKFIDTLNYVLASGNQPKGGVMGYNPDQRSLISSAYLWKQQHTGASPEQVIQGYYDRPVTQGNTADAYRQKLSKIGYGPTSMYHTSQNEDIQMRQGVNQNPQVHDRPVPTLHFDNGGIMYADGGEVETMWGGDVNQRSTNPYDGGTMEFNGQSHEQGGIGMHYNGNPVEVEGGEAASRDSQGNLNIYGNMYLPGTKTKFKTVAKEIADKEKRYERLKMRGSELVNNSSPSNKFEQLSFNAGRAMMAGGMVGHKDLAEKKENLAFLQRAMLDTADEYGLDAQHMSKGKVKKAKGGTYIPFAEDGLTTSGDPNDPKRSDRNHNPGNIRWSKFAREQGAIGRDKDGFAIFPDKMTGMSAMTVLLGSDKYRNLSVKDAINKWTGGKPYKYNLSGLENKKVNDLQSDEFNKVIDTMVQGEGTRYGVDSPKPRVPSPKTPPITPRTYGPPDVSLTPDRPRPIPGKVNPPPLDEINVPRRPVLPSNTEPLSLEEVMGELYAAGTNKVEPVPMQEYRPQLYQPYQVSFQDRINQNQSTYNALQRTLGVSNPSALNAIAAQKYAADSSVKADEFRTNQAISNDITNKNIGLMNDAQLKNLGIADTQMVRQSTARSKTAQLNQMLINSISSKYAQNKLENKRLAAYENLYDYRFVPTDQGGQQATYFGPAATFNFNQNLAAQRNANDIKTVSRYDSQGNLKGYMKYDESAIKDARDAIELEQARRRLPLLTAPPLQ